MTGNIIPLGAGWPMTREQRAALRRIRADLSREVLPLNAEQTLGTAICRVIDTLLAGDVAGVKAQRTQDSG